MSKELKGELLILAKFVFFIAIAITAVVNI